MYFSKADRRKQSPNRGKFAQSGHPDLSKQKIANLSSSRKGC
jgi:hypothetical protein